MENTAKETRRETGERARMGRKRRCEERQETGGLIDLKSERTEWADVAQRAGRLNGRTGHAQQR